MLAAACFAAGLTAGALIAPVGASNGGEALVLQRARSKTTTVAQNGALRGGA